MNYRRKIIDIRSGRNILYMPFQSDLNDDQSRHTVTNSGVVIRDLATFSIPLPFPDVKSAAYFDGSSFMSVPHDNDFKFYDNKFDVIISGLYYTEDSSSYQVIMNHGGANTASESGWNVSIVSSSNSNRYKYSFGGGVSGGRIWSVIGGTFYQNWRFFQCGFIGLQGFSRIDGKRSTQIYGDTYPDTKTYPLQFGKDYNLTAYFTGYMAHLRIDVGIHIPNRNFNYKNLTYLP